ncbi:MAG TPA: MFS transporter [Bacillota bacterium]|nr:MFS transporter [Bacillota bacterium]
MKSLITESKLWTREFLLIIISNLLTYMNFMMITPVLPAYAVEAFGDNKVVVGLVTSLFAISAIIARMFAGVTLDFFGRRKMLTIGILIFTLSTAGYYAAGGIVLFLLFRMVYGFGFGITGTAYGTMAADVIPPKRIGEGMGYYGLSSSISLSIAPVIGIWLMSEYGFGVLILVSVLLAVFVFPTLFMINIPPKVKTTKICRGGWFEKTAVLPCTLNVFFSITYGVLIGFISLFGKEVGIHNVGLFFLVFSTMVILVRPLSGKLYDRKGHIAVLPFGAILVAFGLVCLSYSQGIVLLSISGLLYGAGFGMIQPALQAWTVQRVEAERRGIATAFFYNSLDFGLAIGSFVLGFVASLSSYAFMYRISALSMAVFLIIYITVGLVGKVKKEKTQVIEVIIETSSK